jgi:hypothetical protein
MARALTAGELTSLRTDNQHSRLYLAVLMPNTVLTAQVNGAPASDDEVYTLTIDGASWGSGYSAAVKDQLVYVGSTSGAYDKGFVRLRENLSGTPTSMKIGEISEIEWADDDYITIVDEFPLAPRHLFIDSSEDVFMDRDVAYSDQHDNPDPVPILGPSLVTCWLTGANVDVNFDASDTWVLTGSISSHSWAVQGTGIAIQSGGATATPTFRITAAGTYRVADTITTSGGASFTAYRYIMCFDSDNMPITQFTLEQCSGEWESGGWSFRVNLYAEAALTDIRERALVCLFARDWYGGTEESIGPITDRETTVALGWVADEGITWDPETGAVALDVRGPHYWLAQMNGFPSGLEDIQTTPAAWTEYEDLTLDAGVWHFIHWRTTLTRILDLNVSGDTRGIALFNAAAGTLWEQLTMEATATILAHPCSDRFGRLYVEEEPQIVPEGDRGSIPTVHTLATQDLRRPFELERRTVPTTGLVDLSGVIYSGGTGTPKFSLSPGHIPKWIGGAIERMERLALSSQGQSNTLSGLILGWRNCAYPNVFLPLASNHRMIDVTPHQYVVLAISSGDTIRGLSETLTLVARSVSFNHNPRTGALLTDVRAEAVTVAAGSQDGDIPPDPPDPGFPPLPGPIWDPEPDTEPEWPADVFFASEDEGIYVTDDFTGTDDAGQPTWTAINTDLPADLDILSFAIDRQDGYGGKARQFCLVTTARDVYRRVTSDLSGDGAWDVVLSQATYRDASHCNDANCIAQDIWSDPVTGYIYVYITSTNSGSTYGAWVCYSTDGGDTWTANPVVHADIPGGTWYMVGAGAEAGNIEVYNGTIVVSGLWTNGVSNKHRLFKSTNGGGTWASSGALGTITGYLDLCALNPLDTTSGYGRKNIAGPEYAIIKTPFDGSHSQLESDGLWPYGYDYLPQHWFHPTDADTQRHIEGNVWRMYYTDDDWSTYAYITPSPTVSSFCRVVQAADGDMIIYGTHVLGVGVGDNPHAILVAYGNTDTTPEGKAGSSPDSAPYTDSIPYNCGGPCRNGIQAVTT